ncbi:TolC family protein [bacterium]|nr:TolC family protein [bacterium]
MKWLSTLKIYALFFPFIFLLNQHPAAAQQSWVLTYEDAIAIALEKSFTVKSYEARKEAMQHSYQYYKAVFKPLVDFSIFAPSLSESVSPIQRTDGLPVYNSNGILQMGGTLKFTYMLPSGGNFALTSQMYRENLKTVLALRDYEKMKTDQAYSSLSLSFDQPIFTTNTLRENLKEAEYYYEKSSSEFTRRQLDIIYDVTNSFYSLYRAVREVEIASEKLRNSEEAYRIAKLKGEKGKIPEGDVLIAEIEMSQNRANLSEAESGRERNADMLKQLIGLNQEDTVTIVTDLKYKTFEVELNKAIEEAQKNRLELYESELDVKLQNIEIDRAEREQEFKGSISAYYDVTGVSTTGSGTTRSLFESSFDNFVDRPPNRGITLTFSYPVFDWGRGDAKVRKAQVTLKERQLSQENTRETIVREVKDTVRKVNEAKSRLSIYENYQDVAKRSYDISRMRFENGDITSQELAREQERLAEVQLNYLDAFITYELALADLKRQTLWDFENNRTYLINRQEQGK